MLYDGGIAVEMFFSKLGVVVDSFSVEEIFQVFALAHHVGDKLVDINIVGIDVGILLDGHLIFLG